MPDSYFRRGAERVHCLLNQDRTGYSLTLRTPGGGSITQRFRDAASRDLRLRALERMLLGAGWSVDAPALRRAG